MSRLIASMLCLLLAIPSPTASQEPKPAAVELNGFESQADLGNLEVKNAEVSLSAEHATAGLHALRIKFTGNGRATLQFRPADASWDWSMYGGMGFDLVNPSDDEIGFALQLDDSVAGGEGNQTGGAGSLGPRLTVSYLFPLGSSFPQEHGMVGAPALPGFVPVTFISKSHGDEARVKSFTISFAKPKHADSVYLDNVRLLPAISYDGIVDPFGQDTRQDWPAKLKTEAQLQQRRQLEETALRSTPTLAGLDEYGGWAAGPQLQHSNFFTTTQRDGKWWLVDPDGHLFFSLGVDAIGLHETPTMIEGRENLFTWLPKDGEPLAKHYGETSQVLYGPRKQGRTFDFYGANLERKYGHDYAASWASAAVQRLRAWGFNTIGNWSDAELFALKKVPYTVPLEIQGDYARVSSGIDYWGKMHDPFDPKFALAVKASVKEGALKYRDDPWLIGYFVDNEISWGGMDNDREHYGLVYGTLNSDQHSPAKHALVNQLTQKYGQVAKLNEVWGSQFGSWEDLLAKPYRPGDPFSAAMQQDFSAFLTTFAEQYFRVVRDALRAVDPHHLYLGCRFAWRNPEAVEAAARYTDVVSFNVYASHLDPEEWAFATKLNKPCLIGEFHFGALDRGMFHTGLVMAPNQQTRAAMYRRYVESVADNAAFVGCHWFQYVDEPLTGRTYDGENYNIGFVDATDTPYAEMVESARAVHSEMYRRHAGK